MTSNDRCRVRGGRRRTPLDMVKGQLTAVRAIGPTATVLRVLVERTPSLDPPTHR